MANNIPITEGQGQSSVAAEQIGTTKYQQIKLVGGEVGSTSVLGVNPDRSINVSVIGAVTVTGSIIAAGNQSVSGTVGASVIGLTPVGSPTGVATPATAVPVGVSIGGFNTAVGGNNQADNNTLGSALNTATVPYLFNGSNFDRWRGNSSIGALVSTGASSVIVVGQQGASVSGAVTAPAGSVMTVATLAGSVMSVTNPAGSVTAVSATFVAGSVATFITPAGSVQAVRTDNASVIAVLQSSSIIAVSTGSIVTVPTGSVITVFQAPSIVGTYAEDAASASGDKGFLVMGARNDTLASVTSNDGDYSSHVVGPAGELIAENAPLTKWVSGTASMLGGVPLTCSVTVIAAQGASVFTYITGIQVANLSASSVLVSFGGGTSSLIGYTIAPPGGGSNIYYQNGIKTNANSAFSASVSGTSSVYVSAQGFISKT